MNKTVQVLSLLSGGLNIPLASEKKSIIRRLFEYFKS